jgi:hypothetical protein
MNEPGVHVEIESHTAALRVALAEAFHEHRRHMLRFTLPFCQITDEAKKFRWARLMGAAWVCLRDGEKDEPYHFADQLIAQLQEKGLIP